MASMYFSISWMFIPCPRMIWRLGWCFRVLRARSLPTQISDQVSDCSAAALSRHQEDEQLLQLCTFCTAAAVVWWEQRAAASQRHQAQPPEQLDTSITRVYSKLNSFSYKKVSNATFWYWHLLNTWYKVFVFIASGVLWILIFLILDKVNHHYYVISAAFIHI